MNNELITKYKECIEEGISISELYIYSLLVDDGRCYGKDEDEIVELINDVKTTASILGIGWENAVAAYLDEGVPELYIDEDDEEWE